MLFGYILYINIPKNPRILTTEKKMLVLLSLHISQTRLIIRPSNSHSLIAYQRIMFLLLKHCPRLL